MRRSMLLVILTFLGLVCWVGQASAQTGQVALGRSTVEPAVNDADGSTVFLLTPDKVPFPSNANAMHATAPMFIPMYPDSSSINPATLNCQPHNCDHLNVLPFAAPGYTNGGSACTSYGLPANQCSLVIGHDHLVGIAPTGDFNVAWHVNLVVFTPKGIADGKANARVLTLADIASLTANGEAFLADTPITFNCSRVASAVYYKGVPLSF